VRAVVTGGAGFVGSTLVDALLVRGDEVHVVDDLSSGRREQVAEAAPLHVRDIREPLDDLFGELRPAVVFHLAAQIDVRVSVADPVRDAHANVLGTINVLEAARPHGAQVIFASTGGAIYGECDEPAVEDAPRRPLAPYGTSKLAAEEYLATWNRLYGSAHVALRLGNVYGPRQDPHGEAGVVAIRDPALRPVFDPPGHRLRTPRCAGRGGEPRPWHPGRARARCAAAIAATQPCAGTLPGPGGRPATVHRVLPRAVDARRLHGQ
jgi:nucleoside-diphosphate-sugar epimerase